MKARKYLAWTRRCKCRYRFNGAAPMKARKSVERVGAIRDRTASMEPRR